MTQGAGDATRMARHFVQSGFDVVAAVGGDGTASETARGLMGADTALAVVPFGSGNGLARGLGLPLDIEASIRIILSGRTRAIDVGEVTDGEQQKFFFGFAGIGYDAFVGSLFNRRQGRRGLLAYVSISVTAFRSFTPVAVRIRLNDKEIFARPFILAVANTSEYGNGAKIAPQAIPDDGYLEVCLLQDMTFFKGLVHGWRLFHGSIDKMSGATMMRSRSIDVIPEGKIHYHLDGEPCVTQLGLRFAILPGHLKVVVP